MDSIVQTGKYVYVVYRSVHICTSSFVNQDDLAVEPVNYFNKVFTNAIKKLFPSNSFAKDAIFHCGDFIKSKLVTAVDELKGPD